MKKRINRPWILFLTVTLILTVAFNVETKGQQSKKELRKEKKAQKEKEQQEAFLAAKAAMLDTSFVIPAESIQFERGAYIPVTGNINFLKITGNESVLQIGSTFAAGTGLNDLGGVTLKGRVANLKISQKKDNVYMRYVLSGIVGTANISVSINGSDQAVVNVDGMFSGKSFTMQGTLVRPEDASIYQGTDY
jgi:hypothetical protein